MKDAMIKKLHSIAVATTAVLWLCAVSVTAQNTAFPYPAVPDTLRQPQARADYLLLHYWDNVDFADTTLLCSQDYGEQGFVNYIDLLGRFGKNVGPQSAKIFIDKAWSCPPARRRFDSLIDQYLDDNSSPLRNDRTYSLLLNAIADDGSTHSIREYSSQRLCLFFYDPDCENCHTVWTWMQAHPLPADVKILRIKVNDRLTIQYAIKATPTIYLLDKNNIVTLKDCTPEQLVKQFK